MAINNLVHEIKLTYIETKGLTREPMRGTDDRCLRKVEDKEIGCEG
jgi:hypothetical protein